MFQFTEADEIVMNLAGGLPVENLTEHEVSILTAEYGKDWKKALGYEK